MRTIDVYDISDVIERAIKIVDDSPCDGGPYCPRCRIATAVTQLDDEFDTPHGFGDGIIISLTRGIPRKVWSKHESNDVLREMLK